MSNSSSTSAAAAAVALKETSTTTDEQLSFVHEFLDLFDFMHNKQATLSELLSVSFEAAAKNAKRMLSAEFCNAYSSIVARVPELEKFSLSQVITLQRRINESLRSEDALTISMAEIEAILNAPLCSLSEESEDELEMFLLECNLRREIIGAYYARIAAAVNLPFQRENRELYLYGLQGLPCSLLTNLLEHLQTQLPKWERHPRLLFRELGLCDSIEYGQSDSSSDTDTDTDIDVFDGFL